MLGGGVPVKYRICLLLLGFFILVGLLWLLLGHFF